MSPCSPAFPSRFPPGDRLGLVAANGRGKTSLLACLAGVAAPQAGEITRARGLKLALVAQDVPGALLPLTLRACTLSGLSSDQAADENWRAEIALDALAVPEALRDLPLSQVSGAGGSARRCWRGRR